MTTYPAAPDAPVLVLTHGAGAGERHPWMRAAGEGLARRGITVVTFDFPYMQEGRRVPDRGPVLEARLAEAWREVRATMAAAGSRPRAWFAGGKSMGGRIASQLAARNGFEPTPSGLIFFGYPLHPPKRPDARRDRHLPAVGIPMLFIHGTRDPFGTIDEMEPLVASLRAATLVAIAGGDHSLEGSRRKQPADDSPQERLARPLDAAAEWISLR